MFGNWIRQTTTTTGTGPLTLSPVSGYPTFADEFAAGERFQYQVLDDATAAPIESGMGYLSGGALVRERIECTMVSGTFDNTTPAAVSLAAGTKRVICAVSAASTQSVAAGAFGTSSAVKGYGDGNLIFGSGGGYVTAGGRGFAMPFSAQAANEIDAVLVRVTTAGPGGTLMRGAIYSIGADGLPDVQLALSGTEDGATTGLKSLTFTAFRPPQRFFVAVITSSSLTVYGTPSGVNGGHLGFFNTNLETVGIVSKDGSGTTFPSSWASPFTDVVFAWRPVLGVRCV
jgi:hypothetical protein